MTDHYRIDCGSPGLLEFRGPDAVRFLNGQVTQDVRRVADEGGSLPSCVTDSKGRLQFRVWLTRSDDGALWVEGPEEAVAELEARLTRYLIADDVEADDLTGRWSLVHFCGTAPEASGCVKVRENQRFGVAGSDWWIPAGEAIDLPPEPLLLRGAEFEAWRIAKGVPLWGMDLCEGLLPAEAGLAESDISYHKGCYIGQEVISRIKFAGKVNKRLVRLSWSASVASGGLVLTNEAGEPAGEVTSVSPVTDGDLRHALGFVKRGVAELFVVDSDGGRFPVSVG